MFVCLLPWAPVCIGIYVHVCVYAYMWQACLGGSVFPARFGVLGYICWRTDMDVSKVFQYVCVYFVLLYVCVFVPVSFPVHVSGSDNRCVPAQICDMPAGTVYTKIPSPIFQWLVILFCPFSLSTS